jgi:Spy/CpxP family protein refolding chaperone
MRRLTRRLATTLAALLALGTASESLAGQGTGPGAPPRERLEQQVRERLARVVQQRLELSDEQMRKLQATNRKFDDRRRALFEQERDARTALREQLVAGDRADQQNVGDLLDRLLDVQQQRLDLVRQEQRELAGYLTPVQRAKYLVLQDQLRRRMEEMRRRHMMRRDGRSRTGPPGLP